MREIVLDTETTGLDPLRGDRLVEIGCVEIFNRMPTGQIFHVHINPERAMPAEAFEIGINLTSIGLLWAWGVIIVCQLRLRSLAKAGRVERPAFRMPGAPVTSYLTLGFLAVVGVLILLDWPTGTITVGAAVVIIVPLQVGGWFLVRGRVREAAARDAAQGAASPAAPEPAAEGAAR